MPILKVIALGYSLLKKEHLYLLKFKCDLQDFVYHLQNGLGKSQIKIIFTLKPISGCSQWLWLLSMQNGNIPSVAYKWYPPWGEMDSSVPWDRLVIHTTAHTDVKHIMLDSKSLSTVWVHEYGILEKQKYEDERYRATCVRGLRWGETFTRKGNEEIWRMTDWPRCGYCGGYMAAWSCHSSQNYVLTSKESCCVSQILVKMTWESIAILIFIF